MSVTNFGSVNYLNNAPLKLPRSSTIQGGLTFPANDTSLTTGLFCSTSFINRLILSVDGQEMFLWDIDAYATTQCLTSFRIQQNLSEGMSLALVDGPTTGINFTSGEGTFYWNGVSQGYWYADGFALTNVQLMKTGDFTHPIIYPQADSGTGIAFPGEGLLTFIGSNVNLGVWSSLGLTINTLLYVPVGLISDAPPVSFSGFPTTGFYSPSGTSIVYRIQGNDTLTLTADTLESTTPFLAPAGMGTGISKAAYSFYSHDDTGIFSSDGEDIQFTTSGGLRAIIDENALSTTVGLFVDNEFSVTGDSFLNQVNLRKEVIIMAGSMNTDVSHSGAVYVAGLGFLTSPPLPPGLPDPPGLDPLPYTLTLIPAALGTFYTIGYADSSGGGEFLTIETSGGLIGFDGQYPTAIKTNTQASSIQLTQCDAGGPADFWLATAIQGTWVAV